MAIIPLPSDRPFVPPDLRPDVEELFFAEEAFDPDPNFEDGEVDADACLPEVVLVEDLPPIAAGDFPADVDLDLGDFEAPPAVDRGEAAARAPLLFFAAADLLVDDLLDDLVDEPPPDDFADDDLDFEPDLDREAEERVDVDADFGDFDEPAFEPEDFFVVGMFVSSGNRSFVI